MTNKTLEDMEMWADEARSYCMHVGHVTADTKMADYLNAVVKELKRHMKAVEHYRTWLENVPLRMEKHNEKMAKKAVEEGEAILND